MVHANIELSTLADIVISCCCHQLLTPLVYLWVDKGTKDDTDSKHSNDNEDNV